MDASVVVCILGATTADDDWVAKLEHMAGLAECVSGGSWSSEEAGARLAVCKRLCERGVACDGCMGRDRLVGFLMWVRVGCTRVTNLDAGWEASVMIRWRVSLPACTCAAMDSLDCNYMDLHFSENRMGDQPVEEAKSSIDESIIMISTQITEFNPQIKSTCFRYGYRG